MFPVFMFSQDRNSSEEGQSNSMLLCFGPAVSYFQGEYPGSYEKYQSDRLNVQVDGFLGYLSQRKNRNNALGVFGTAGYTNQSTLLKMLDLQNIQYNQIDSSDYYTFYQIEFGMMAGKVLRFSTGYGKQDFKTDFGNRSMEYFSSTVGLNIDFGAIAWKIDANFNYGLDYSKTILKISTGLLVML